MGELLRLTHPVRTQLQPSLGAWHDAKGAEVASMRVFRTLGEALDMPGLRAVSSLLAARTAQMLTAATHYVEGELEAGRHPGFVSLVSSRILAGALPAYLEATAAAHSSTGALIPIHGDQRRTWNPY